MHEERGGIGGSDPGGRRVRCGDGASRDRTSPTAAVRNDLRIVIGAWRPDPIRCDGVLCTSTGDDAPRYRVLAGRLSAGRALVVLVRTDRGAPRRVWQRWVTVPRGVLAVDTPWHRCRQASNGFFRVMDGASGRWSARAAVSVGCAAL
jgi:hypothetical protein